MSTTQARDWFADEAEFRQLCGDAQSQANGESSQDFAAEMVIKAKERGLGHVRQREAVGVALQAGRLGRAEATSSTENKSAMKDDFEEWQRKTDEKFWSVAAWAIPLGLLVILGSIAMAIGERT